MQPGIRPGQTPHFYELEEYTFEDVCRDIYANEPGIATCEMYGVRGQQQFGIDLIARPQSGDGVEVGQSKRYAEFPPHEIRKAPDEFLEHWDTRWSAARVRRFVLFVACELNTVQQQDEVTAQTAKFAALNVKYEVWSAPVIRNKLRSQPGIVATYFDPADYWVQVICGTVWAGSPWHDPSSSRVTSSLLVSQLEELATLHSDELRQTLERMRHALREGRRQEARDWVCALKENRTEWAVLSPSVRAQILRFEAGLELDRGDVASAESLADEALGLAPSDDESTIRALVAWERHDAHTATRLLESVHTLQAQNLLASLYLESGSVARAHAVLDLTGDLGGPDAETFRLDALVRVFERDLARARVAAQRAAELAPRWKSIQLANAIVDYFSALAPLAVPLTPVDWPEPTDWMVVKRDSESLARVRAAGQRFHDLASTADLPHHHRKLYRIWQLACLANDPAAQDEGLELCRKLLEEDASDFQALAWATARSYEVDLATSEASIRDRLSKGTASIPQVIALSRAFLVQGQADEAVSVNGHRERPTGGRRGIHRWPVVSPLVASESPHPG